MCKGNKCRHNAWFTTDLANLFHVHNMAWAKVRRTKLHTDWLLFKQLCDAYTVVIRTVKADYFVVETYRGYFKQIAPIRFG